jgi:prepilin-type N-terminal cleavage/methylation domain-containing protein
MKSTPHHNALRRGARPAFTLIELTIAIALTGIVSAGLMSALLFSIKAIPAAGDAGITAARLDAASEFLLADAMLASAVSGSGAKISLTVPDQTGDAAADTVVYTIDAGTLTRELNGGDPRTLASNIASGAFGVLAIDGKVVTVTALLKTDRNTVHLVSAECLARPETP